MRFPNIVLFILYGYHQNWLTYKVGNTFIVFSVSYGSNWTLCNKITKFFEIYPIQYHQPVNVVEADDEGMLGKKNIVNLLMGRYRPTFFIYLSIGARVMRFPVLTTLGGCWMQWAPLKIYSSVNSISQPQRVKKNYYHIYHFLGAVFDKFI